MTTTSRLGLPFLLALAALAPLCACVRSDAAFAHRREGPDATAEGAVGHVSVSAPMFTPIEDKVADGKRLEFGDYRKEENLANEMEQLSRVTEREELTDRATRLWGRDTC